MFGESRTEPSDNMYILYAIIHASVRCGYGRNSSTTWRSFHLKDREQKMKNYILTGEPHGSDFDVKNDGKIT